jgi:hypothetical protein
VLVVLELALSVGHAPTLAQRLLGSTRLCAQARATGSGTSDLRAADYAERAIVMRQRAAFDDSRWRGTR